jgi:hypothetical protein
MIDRRPGAIVRCADVADVITAVNFARNEDVAVTVRGGGHNGGGLGVCDRGLVIDLSSMVSEDLTGPARRVVWVFRIPESAAGTAFSGGVAPENDVRNRLSLLRAFRRA